MGIVVVQSAKITMKTFVALSALVASALAAPAAEADAQLLAAGYTGLAGVGLAGVAPYAAGVLPAATVEAKYAAAPAVAPAATLAYAAAPAVHTVAAPAVHAVAAPAVAYAAAPVATVHHTVHQPIVPVHAVKEQVITAPVVRHVGTQVHHQVHHIPQVHVDTKTSHPVSTHIINHPPQIGAFVAPGLALAAAPAIVAAAPVVEAAAPAEEAAVEAA